MKGWEKLFYNYIAEKVRIKPLPMCHKISHEQIIVPNTEEKLVVITCPAGANRIDIDTYILANLFPIYNLLAPYPFASLSQSVDDSSKDDPMSVYSCDRFQEVGNLHGYPIMYKRLRKSYLSARIVNTGSMHIEIIGDAYNIDNVIEYVKENIDSIIEKHVQTITKPSNPIKKNSSYIDQSGFSYANPREDISDTEWEKQIKHKRKSSTIERPRSTSSFYKGEAPRVVEGQIVISGQDGRAVPFTKNDDDFREQQ